MKKTILSEAYKIACRKIEFHPEYDHYIHFTFVVQGNKIIEWGTNNKAVPAVHFGYQARLENETYTAKMHSEWVAYRKAKGLMRRNKPFDIVNIRLNKKKELKMSKPCRCCHRIMKGMGCRKIHYSNERGFFEDDV